MSRNSPRSLIHCIEKEKIMIPPIIQGAIERKKVALKSNKTSKKTKSSEKKRYFLFLNLSFSIKWGKDPKRIK